MRTDQQIGHDLQRILPELELKFGVARMGYVRAYTSKHTKPKPELNVIVELKHPMGWRFFELKEYIERKVMARIDVVTPGGLKVLYRNQILDSVSWL